MIFILLLLAGIAQANNENIQIKIQFADTTSEYRVSPKKISYSDSQGGAKENTLSEADYKFLISEFKAMKSPSNDRQFCPRNYMQIEIGKENKIACVEGKTKLSAQMASFLKLLKAAI